MTMKKLPIIPHMLKSKRKANFLKKVLITLWHTLLSLNCPHPPNLDCFLNLRTN